MWDYLILAYESLGNAYKCLFQYHKAIVCFKKQIQLAWLENNKVSELRAYDNIGLQYYYLGNKQKARYYHKRFILGKGEKETTDKRKSMCEEYRVKHLLYDKMKAEKLSEDQLKYRLQQVISTYQNKLKSNKETAKEYVDIHSVDYHQLQEVTHNSMLSNCDMTFIEGRFRLNRGRRSKRLRRRG